MTSAPVAATDTVLLTGGEVVDPSGRRFADVLISEGQVAAVDATAHATADAPGSVRTLDVSGCIVTPGFVDLFACLGEPGNEQAETVATATTAAALGGYTAVLAQPNTDPPLDNVVGLAELKRLAQQAPCTVVPAATLSIGRAGTHLAPFAELKAAGVNWFTDVGPHPDPQLLLRAMEYGRSLGITIAVNPSDPDLSKNTVMAEGQVSAALGLKGEPEVSEWMAAHTVSALARGTGCSAHLDRISTVSAIDVLTIAKEPSGELHGGCVTGSVTAQHLYFTDADCADFNPLLRAQPPYRDANERDALRAGVAKGTIDAIVSGHTPHTSEDVEVPFELAPPGVLALQTAASVAIGSCGLELEAALAALSWKPAALAGVADRHGCVIEPGSPANITVFDPNVKWQPTIADLASRSHNSPYLGHTLTGRVRHTIHEGRLVVLDGQAPDGQAPDYQAL